MGLNAKNLKVSITPEMIPTMHEDKNEFYSGARIKLNEIDLTNCVSEYEISKELGELAYLVLKIPLFNEPTINT